MDVSDCCYSNHAITDSKVNVMRFWCPDIIPLTQGNTSQREGSSMALCEEATKHCSKNTIWVHNWLHNLVTFSYSYVNFLVKLLIVKQKKTPTKILKKILHLGSDKKHTYRCVS